MKLSEIRSKYVFTTKITLDEDTGDYIELREPNQAEVMGFSGEAEEIIQKMEVLFPNCIINSSFTNEDGSPATGEQIYNELSASGSMLTEILNRWLESVPFQRRLTKSEK